MVVLLGILLQDSLIGGVMLAPANNINNQDPANGQKHVRQSGHDIYMTLEALYTNHSQMVVAKQTKLNQMLIQQVHKPSVA